MNKASKKNPDWFNEMSDHGQRQYIRAHPKSTLVPRVPVHPVSGGPKKAKRASGKGWAESMAKVGFPLPKKPLPPHLRDYPSEKHDLDDDEVVRRPEIDEVDTSAKDDPYYDPLARTFKEDRRKDNAALHLLYTKTAVVHLRAIDDTLRRFYDFSNLKMTGPDSPCEALENARKKLCDENAAYCQADEILKSIGLVIGAVIVRADLEESYPPEAK